MHKLYRKLVVIKYLYQAGSTGPDKKEQAMARELRRDWAEVRDRLMAALNEVAPAGEHPDLSTLLQPRPAAPSEDAGK